jgi:hypothetical protein
MQARNAILFGGLAVLGYSLIRKGAAGANLLFYPDGIKGFYWRNLSPVVRFAVRVHNTSNQSFTINSFACDVSNEGVTIGTASFYGAQIIPANNQMILLVDVQLMAIAIVTEIISAIETKNFSFPILVKGTANVDGLVIPVTLNYKAGF